MNFDPVIFDMDGGIAGTTAVRSGAWKATFAGHLRFKGRHCREPFREITHSRDYLLFTDGHPRNKRHEADITVRDHPKISVERIDRQAGVKQRHTMECPAIHSIMPWEINLS